MPGACPSAGPGEITSMCEAGRHLTTGQLFVVDGGMVMVSG